MNWSRLILLPLVVLVASLSVTWMLWDHERQAARHELVAQFDFSLGDAVSRVEQRMGTYELLLRGVQSMFAASIASAFAITSARSISTPTSPASRPSA